MDVSVRFGGFERSGFGGKNSAFGSTLIQSRGSRMQRSQQ
jgi:hypothetical protein